MARADDERIGFGAAVGLGALVLATFVAITTEIVPVGLLPQLSRAFGVSEGVTGLLVTVYAGLVAVLAIPLTRLTARLPRKPLLLGTIVLYSIGNAMITVAPTFALVCVGRAVGGVAHALFFSGLSADAAAIGRRRCRARAGDHRLRRLPRLRPRGPARHVDRRRAGPRAASGALAIGGVLSLLITVARSRASASRAPRRRTSAARAARSSPPRP